jgi:hypothetical protein
MSISKSFFSNASRATNRLLDPEAASGRSNLGLKIDTTHRKNNLFCLYTKVVALDESVVLAVF